jgi:hypothetical protein
VCCLVSLFLLHLFLLLFLFLFFHYFSFFALYSHFFLTLFLLPFLPSPFSSVHFLSFPHNHQFPLFVPYTGKMEHEVQTQEKFNFEQT